MVSGVLGRPPIDPEKRRSVQVAIRFTPKEFFEFQRLATDGEFDSVSDFIRSKIFGKRKGKR